ncbi:MAG: hypothetical protein ACREC8_10970 [Limisphaerales bacterium]
MTDDTGKAQGLGIDDLSFSASISLPVSMNIQVLGTNFFLSWSAPVGQTYQIEYKDNLNAPSWTPLGDPILGTGGIVTVTNSLTLSTQRFFRIVLQ